MEKSYEELKAVAIGLGIEFKGNPKKAELESLIEEHYESQSAGDLVKVQEEEEVKETTVKPAVKGLKKNINKVVAKAKEDAMKTKVVTISSIDKRTSDLETTAYLGFENQYFGLSKLVPLDTPIELEVCLIEIAKTTEILTHVDEIVNGKRTGNKVPKKVKKYNVSFEEVK